MTESIKILSRHFVIDAERVPAHRPVRLPLQLATPARHGRFKLLQGRWIAPSDRARGRVMRQHRRLHDHACFRVDRQEGRIGGCPLLAQRGQHDRLHLVEQGEHPQERLIEPPGLVGFGRRHEFVFEAEPIEKGAQHRVVVLGEARIFAEGVGNLGQRLAEMGQDQIAVRDVVGNLAQAVHVVGKSDQPRLDAASGEDAEGVPHHACARDLAERADMRQTRGAVASLEDHLFAFGAFEARDQLSRFFERPRFRSFGGLTQGLRRHGSSLGCPVLSAAEQARAAGPAIVGQKARAELR